MSEHQPKQHHENIPVGHEHQQLRSAEHQISHTEQLRKEHEQVENLKHAQQEASHEAQTTNEIAEKLALHQQERPQHDEVHANRELKEMAYQRLLTRARRHMSPYSRLMSHVIHQPVVDKISEAASRSVGRPSGILGGGLVALLGTTAYYYIAKHYGYNYNSFVFLLLLVCGFIIGWTLELSYKFFKVFRKK